MTNEAEDQLSKAMMRIYRTSPYYSHILMRHKKIQDTSVNGASINGSELRYNPEMIMDVPVSEMAEHLKHMAMHIAFGHHLRAADMEPRYAGTCKEKHVEFEKIFNEAADLAVNSLLRKNNEVVWSGEGMHDAPMPGRGDWMNFADELAAEEYFKPVLELRENLDPQTGPGEGEGSGSGGASGENDQNQGQNDQQDQNDSQGGSNGGGQPQHQKEHRNWGQVEKPSKPMHEAEQEHQEQVAGAVMAAKSAGEGTGTVNEFILKYEAPVKVDWRAETREFLQHVCRGRPNYKRLNRRMFGSSIVFPTNKDKSPRKCVLLVDVSGSMDDDCVAAVFSHIEALIEAHPQLEVVVAQFDYDVFEDSVKTYDRNNIPINAEERGRVGYGGTRFMPAFEWAEKQEDVSGVIMLTDLIPSDGREFQEYKPDMPTIVLSVLNYQFGDCLNNHYSRYKEMVPKGLKVLEIEP